jgi:hypothetical protein
MLKKRKCNIMWRTSKFVRFTPIFGVLVFTGCGSGDGTGNEPVGTLKQEVREIRPSMPVDDSPQVDAEEKPKNLIRAGAFHKASADRVEILEGTFRTAGSRRFLLEGIKNGEGEYREALIQTYAGVLPNLPAAEADAAQAELDAVLAALKAGKDGAL